MKSRLNTLGFVLAISLVGVLLTSCASDRVKEANKKAKENKEEYVDYYPVGSNLPIRVPKDQAKASAKETQDTERGFRDIQRATQQPTTGTQTGIPGAQHTGGGGL